MENLKAKATNYVPESISEQMKTETTNTQCPICGGKTYARFFENKLTEKQ
jgi:hypothetical protein